MAETTRNAGCGCLPALLLLLLGVILIEFIGQKYLFADKLYFVNDVDHRLKPNTSETNADGIRSAREAAAFRPGDENVIFLGDSFVHGLLVEREESIPAQFELIANEGHETGGTNETNLGRALPDSAPPAPVIRAANFGWVSSSPFLSLRLLRDIGAKYSPDLVVLCIDMTDFQDDIKYRKLLARRGIYSMIGKMPVTIMGIRKVMAAVPWMHGLHERLFGFPAPRFFITAAPLEETERWFEPIRASIDSIDIFTREELGARFALFVFPRSYQYSDREVPQNWEAGDYEPLGPYALEPFRYFARMKSEVPYGVHSLLAPFETTDVFPTCFAHDPHWNADGNRIAARAIYDTLRAEGLLGPE